VIQLRRIKPRRIKHDLEGYMNIGSCFITFQVVNKKEVSMRIRLNTLLATTLAFSIFGYGCSTPRADEDDSPIHTSVICLTHEDGTQVTCEGSYRFSKFMEWIDEALYRPGSTFTIWSVGPGRQDYHPFFTACIPSSWGSNVSGKKTKFIKIGQERASGNQGMRSLPEGCMPPGPQTPGTQRLYVDEKASPINLSVWQDIVSRHSQKTESPLHMAVVCDRSTSTYGISCTAAGLRGAFDLWLFESQAQTGASFSVYKVGTSYDTAEQIYTVSMPERSVAEKVSFLIIERNKLDQLPTHKNGSALIEAINLAVSGIRERKGQYQLVILSDLRQITSGKWDFGKPDSIPTLKEFVEWLHNEKLFVDLKNVSVSVCGLHHRDLDHHRFQALMITKLRDIWNGTFEAMGATQIDMSTMCEVAFEKVR
jgi:hypothetical protein